MDPAVRETKAPLPRRAAVPHDAIEEDLAVHIFTTSAALVGVCLTVIGLFRVLSRLNHIGTFGDDLLAVDALIFLFACLLSYLALRTRRQNRRRRLERVADGLFLSALSLMAVVCALITYEVV